MRKLIHKLDIAFSLLICIIFTLLICTYLFFVPLANNFKLHNQEKKLAELELPDSTQLIEKQSVCGKLCGNGNGMNYLVTILIKSNLSLEELQSYYSDFEVVLQISPEFENDCLEHDSIYYSNLKDVVNFDNYYVVYSFTSADFGSIWEWDLRGH